jgi:predicted metal-dependent phosphoesterase TrpH
MSKAQRVSICLILVALAAGTLSDIPRKNPIVLLGGYRVLAADFHVHSFPLSWALLGPFDTVEEAKRQQLDVIAMTPHNLLWVGQVGHWYSQLTGGLTVIEGEEIVSPKFHLLGIGIQKTVNWNQSAASAIDEIHKQGGIAIAAHPMKSFWSGYDADAVRKLDGTEVLHPLAYDNPPGYRQLQEFYARAHVTAIGDSDYHGLGPMGECRTFVFARENSEAAVLDALKVGRTTVYDRDGRAYGDPQLIALAAQNPEFQQLLHPQFDEGWRGLLAMMSRVCGIFGLIGLFLFSCGRREERIHIRGRAI